MSTPTESYLKVHYELRPAKQVERRMLVDAFQLLAQAGFRIRNYQYTGMGSIYFVDFMLMHRLLGINKMLSVEYSQKVRKRVEFNRPFAWVETRIAAIGDVIPSLSRRLKHILWLDYDGVVQSSHLQDVTLAATYLTPGSVLLVTVDIEADSIGGPADWLEHFSQQGGDLFDPSLRVKHFGRSQLARRHVNLLANAINAGLVGKVGYRFLPMFNFVYKDGHEMLTIGGMIGREKEARMIQASGLARTKYYRRSFLRDPCVINVPRLTRKERQYLDAKMPCVKGWTPRVFELSSAQVEAYQQIYRYCPTYAELLV
jgi:hypothetical protein